MTNPTGAKVDYQDFNDDTIEFVKKLKRVLADINIRIAAVENIKGMVDEFERRYGEVALHRIEAAIAPVLQTMLDGLAETRAALAELDEDYRTNGQQRVDGIINPLVAEAQAALAAANAQVQALEQFLSLKQSVAEKGLANGYASLGADGKIPTSQLPASVLGAMAFQATWNANNNTPAIPAASAANKGHYYKVAVAGATNIGGIIDWQVGDMIVSNGASWDKIDNTEQVMSVAGLMGAIPALALKTALALQNVDNTSDANKPVSSAQQTALNGKSNTGHTHAFSDLTAKPTSMAGYGITDGTKVQAATFLVSGTWTKPAGLSADAIVQVEIWGGGGGGGSYGGGASVGGGGGGGCYVTRTFRAADLPATVAVTIGGGGGVNAAGGSSTFGAYATAAGGNAGGSSGGGFNQGGAGGTGGTSEGLSFDMFKGGAGSASGSGNAGGSAYYGGGGGGGGTGGSGQPGGAGGWSIFGGGGGGGYDKPGGVSWFGGGGGGNGGAVATVPGGGGQNGIAGAAGKCLVRTIG